MSRAVQRRLLPRNAPRVTGYDVAAGTTTEDDGRGHTVWDWITLGNGRPLVLAYNVQGTGLPASHDLVAVRAVLRALASEYVELTDILPRANAALSQAAVSDGRRFVECAAVVLDADWIEWSSAGRVPAGVIRRDGTFDELGSHGPPLGMMEGFRYGSRRISMGPGDIFVVLTEASMGLFRGAADLVAQVQGRTAGEVVGTLHRAVRKAHGDRPRETTVILIRKH
ncbi:MAG TPA: PP2C family protein-serine/threonine phosphatase [Longimicrobiales bacterium]|nr:PP2C family protein-serine/threonine phosphatase [Longimicrobiales bacterium]